MTKKIEHGLKKAGSLPERGAARLRITHNTAAMYTTQHSTAQHNGYVYFTTQDGTMARRGGLGRTPSPVRA